MTGALKIVRNTSTISDMKSASNSTAEAVKAFVRRKPAGEPFTTSELLGLGKRAAIDQALSRMARADALDRVAPGVYVRPQSSKYVSRVMPSPENVARAIARASGSAVEVHGAEAAREFGLTTQVPMQPVFATSGRSRTIRYGASTIEMRHRAPKRMLLAGRPAGRAFAALMYLGNGKVTDETIEVIRERLPEAEFDLLASSGARASMPAWLSDVFHGYENTHEERLADA
jgi:hypothetical protein